MLITLTEWHIRDSMSQWIWKSIGCVKNRLALSSTLAMETVYHGNVGMNNLLCWHPSITLHFLSLSIHNAQALSWSHVYSCFLEHLNIACMLRFRRFNASDSCLILGDYLQFCSGCGFIDELGILNLQNLNWTIVFEVILNLKVVLYDNITVCFKESKLMIRIP